MAILFVQGNARGVWAAGVTIAVVMAGAPTEGNILVATASISDSVAPSVITSIAQAGVVWTQVLNNNPLQGGVNMDTEIWFGVVGAGANANITVNISHAPNFGGVVNVCEFSGIVTVGFTDQTASNQNPAGVIDTGTTAVTTQAVELWVGSTLGWAVIQTLPSNGFTLFDGAVSNQTSNAFLYKIVGATGAANCSIGAQNGLPSPPATTFMSGVIATFRGTLGGAKLLLVNVGL